MQLLQTTASDDLDMVQNLSPNCPQRHKKIAPLFYQQQRNLAFLLRGLDHIFILHKILDTGIDRSHHNDPYADGV